MAHDAVMFIRALGFDQVDLLGLSMGGFIAIIAQEEPQLVRKVILAGTGPAGGPGIDKVTALTIRDTLKGALTRQDPKSFLFFTATANGRRAGRAFLERLKERTDNRDKAIFSLSSFRAQLQAIHRWGLQAPTDLSSIAHPTLVANGESDRMVPSENTLDLAARLPRGELVPLYPDTGHGGIFQYHDEFVSKALGFLGS
ncbi:alpha/beta fold hydrolase [Streptomyces sp. LZ34]